MPRGDYHKPLLDLEYENAAADKRNAIAKAEGAEFTGISSGSFTEKMLTWDGTEEGQLFAGELKRIAVIKTGGDCTSFDLEVRDEAGGTNLSIVYEAQGAVGSHDKSVEPIPFVIREIGNKAGFIWLAIKPIGGSTGTFIANLFANPRR